MQDRPSSPRLRPPAGIASCIGESHYTTTKPGDKPSGLGTNQNQSAKLTREAFSLQRARSKSPTPASRAGTTRGGPTRTGSSDSYDDSCVLLVCEKPLVAQRVAEALSGGKDLRTRGSAPLRTYDCYAYFPPAARRCSIAVTSVCGHLFCTELSPTTAAEARTDPSMGDVHHVFGSRPRKVASATSARLCVREHLQREAHGRAWLCLFLDCDREGEAIGFEVCDCIPR